MFGLVQHYKAVSVRWRKRHRDAWVLRLFLLAIFLLLTRNTSLETPFPAFSIIPAVKVEKSRLSFSKASWKISPFLTRQHFAFVLSEMLETSGYSSLKSQSYLEMGVRTKGVSSAGPHFECVSDSAFCICFQEALNCLALMLILVDFLRLISLS